MISLSLHAWTFVLLFALLRTASAQETSIKLASDNSSSSFVIRNYSSTSLLSVLGDGSVRFGNDLDWDYANSRLGLGTATPAARFHLSASGSANGNVLFEGMYDSGAVIPVTGAGTRMMWYPKKAAFRAGYVDGSQWNESSIGSYSTAMGYTTSAAGDYGATTIGYYNNANGGYGATAMGCYNIASGDNGATAMGAFSTASGDGSIAIGYANTASGNYSIAIGRNVKTNGKLGSFIIGDASTWSSGRIHHNTTSNQMKMRFDGGYILYSKSDTSTGVYMNGGTSGWSNVCDRNRKENFHAVDGESLLAKIRHLSVTEWNYKNTDASIRYIGPTAQDFWQAFELGGTDSLGINSICIDGVNMAAVQALEKRTAELYEAKARTDRLEEEVRSLRNEYCRMEARMCMFTEEYQRTIVRVHDLENVVQDIQASNERSKTNVGHTTRVVNTNSGE